MEPRAAVAQWQAGKLTVWTGSQRPFGVRSELAQTFGLTEDDVRVIVPDTGAGYGGKHTGEAAIEAARLAKAAGDPVKVVWTRQEEFTWAYFRPAGVIDVSSGVTDDGAITAWEFHNYNSGGSAIHSPYDVPNQKCQAHGSTLPLAPRLLSRPGRHRQQFRPRVAHGRTGLRPQNGPAGFPPQKSAATPACALSWRPPPTPSAGAPPKPAAGRGFGLAVGTEKGSYLATCAEVLADKESGTRQGPARRHRL